MTDDMNELIAAVGPGDAGRLVGMEDAVWVRIGERRSAPALVRSGSPPLHSRW